MLCMGRFALLEFETKLPRLRRCILKQEGRFSGGRAKNTRDFSGCDQIANWVALGRGFLLRDLLLDSTNRNPLDQLK